METDALLYQLIGPANLAVALIAANFIAFALFRVHKALAEAGRRRVAESTQLTWAFVGGTPGAYAGARCSGTRRASSRSVATFTGSRSCRRLRRRR